MHDVRDWAKTYRNMGFAVCRMAMGEKLPTYKAWNLSSLEPDDFSPDDNIGIQTGAISGDLVCVDIDHMDVLRVADQYLPNTAMVEGRPGKPRSHRWYKVKNVPKGLIAPLRVAGGMGGPRTRRFRRPDATLVECIGTGLQTVAPASIWTSRDGSRTEKRQWHSLVEPAEVDCSELYDCVEKLASLHGWIAKSRPRAEVDAAKYETLPMPDLPMATGEAVRQARTFLSNIPGRMAGNGLSHHAYCVACILVIDFALSPGGALPVLVEWSKKCRPQISPAELLRKLESANALERPRGQRLRPVNRHVTVNVNPADDTIYVGLDCAAENRSYVETYPTLHTAIAKVGRRRELMPELKTVSWAGKKILLTPASTVASNKSETFHEYYLADLLRNEGAYVVSIRLPPGGRRKNSGHGSRRPVESRRATAHHIRGLLSWGRSRCVC